MRVLAVVLALLVVFGLVLALWQVPSLIRVVRGRRLRRKATWQVRNYHRDGKTVVTVSLMTPTFELLDEQLVAEFSDLAVDWDDQFLRASETARERAFHLTTSGNEGGGH